MNNFFATRRLPIPLPKDIEKCFCGEPLEVVREYTFSKGKEYLTGWHYASKSCSKHKKLQPINS